jgi:hypothetical protein
MIEWIYEITNKYTVMYYQTFTTKGEQVLAFLVIWIILVVFLLVSASDTNGSKLRKHLEDRSKHTK